MAWRYPTLIEWAPGDIQGGNSWGGDSYGSRAQPIIKELRNHDPTHQPLSLSLPLNSMEPRQAIYAAS